MTTNVDSFQFNASNTFCISLESKPERCGRIQSRMNYFDISFCRWNASTPNDLIDPFFEYLSPLEKSCAQSHVHIWRHIINAGLEYALIIEDDAMFDKEWIQKLNEFCVSFPEEKQSGDWDAIFLNASEPIAVPNQWQKVTEQYLTGAYLISNRGVTRVLNQYNQCFHSSDWMTSRLQYHGASYSYFPWLVIQEGLDSTLGNRVDEDHAKVVSCLTQIDYSLDHYV